MSDEFFSDLCPICNQTISPDLDACPSCGSQLVCPDCRSPLDSPFSCWTCGKTLSEEILRDDRLGVSIGDRFEGGFVFFLNGKGGGMVSASRDFADEVHWADDLSAIRRTKQYVGAGQENTREIADSTVSGSAAHLCMESTWDGHHDWFLPSRDELNLMYRRLGSHGIGDFASSFYWSSSLHISDVWTQDFVSGLTFFAPIHDSMRIRAARCFSR